MEKEKSILVENLSARIAATKELPHCVTHIDPVELCTLRNQEAIMYGLTRLLDK